VWESIGGRADWPNDDQWDALRRADQLDALHPPRSFDPRANVPSTSTFLCRHLVSGVLTATVIDMSSSAVAVIHVGLAALQG
jgi:hypothetical protein